MSTGGGVGNGTNEGRGPSRSSQAVAMLRAGMARPTTPLGDPSAQAALTLGMTPAAIEAFRPHLAARTRFIDDVVLAALDEGITQVVVLGAGYDDRSLRFRSPGVRYFELDHPTTQEDTRRRLLAMGADGDGPILVPADFEVDRVADRLAEAGHDASHASLFVCEGLLVYLEATTVTSLLSAVRSIASPTSRLVATLAVHADGLQSATVVERANASRRNSVAEPWVTILPVGEHVDLFSRSGWSVTEAVDDSLSVPGSVPDRSLNVVALATYGSPPVEELASRPRLGKGRPGHSS